MEFRPAILRNEASSNNFCKDTSCLAPLEIRALCCSYHLLSDWQRKLHLSAGLDNITGSVCKQLSCQLFVSTDKLMMTNSNSCVCVCVLAPKSNPSINLFVHCEWRLSLLLLVLLLSWWEIRQRLIWNCECVCKSVGQASLCKSGLYCGIGRTVIIVVTQHLLLLLMLNAYLQLPWFGRWFKCVKLHCACVRNFECHLITITTIIIMMIIFH